MYTGSAAAMQSPLPPPTASGSFVKTPFAHLLVYALERRLTGSFEFSREGKPTATLSVVQGCPAKIRTTEPVHHLGQVMIELGMVTPEQVQTSLARMKEAQRLQGPILLELGATTAANLDAALRSQVERKVEHLFTLPLDTGYAYYDGIDLLEGFGGGPTPIDPFPVLWRGVRESPAWEHVDATLRRIGTALIRASATAQLERFAFTPQERAVIDVLCQRPTRVVDVAKMVGASLGQLLVYLLLIMKQVDLIDAQNPPTTGPTGTARHRAVQVPSGQAFARVQLQRQPTKLVVEEHVAAHPANDERASTPGIPAPASAFASATPGDIGAMISQSIREPARPSGPPELTPEQAALKTKILERARVITTQNYFEMLGIERDASPEAVQKAFIALAKQWHPDRLPAALADVKDACSKVFTHLTEANATLTDPLRRQDYMTLLKEGGATPDDQAKIQAILEAATEFQKAEFHLKRSVTDPQAYEILKRCVALDPQAEYMATLAWVESHRPEWAGKDKTLEKILVLDRCIQKNPQCERAYFYRAMLYKRVDEPNKALKDFKKAADLNPRNLDAMREVRLFKMRGGALSKPPPAMGGKPSKPPQPEKPGGLFGRLFKK